MVVPHLHLHSSRKSDSSNGGKNDANGSNGSNSNLENGRNSGDSGTGTGGSGGSPIGSPTTAKRTSRFRLGSLKQLGVATRNEVRANVRNDWEWPLPADRDPKEFTSSRVQPDTRFVEREPGSELSDDVEEDDDFGFSTYKKRDRTTGGTVTQLLNGGFSEKKQSPTTTKITMNGSTNGHSRQASKASNSSDAATGTDPSEVRKERRRRRLREELQWNEGLQVFEARRNAWTGSILRDARSGHTVEATDGSADETADTKAAEASEQLSDLRLANNGETEVNSVGTTSTGDSTLAASPPLFDTNGDSTDTTDKTVASHIADDPTGNPSTTGAPQPGQSGELSPSAVGSSSHGDLIPLVPVPPPLISAEHPVRREINPATYPQIYTRVVVQGTAPNVPINLADMAQVLVTGWKMDDQWPPKPAGPLDPLAGRRKKKAKNLLPPTPDGGGGGDAENTKIGGGGGAGGGIVHGIKRVLRITSGGGSNGNSKGSTKGGGGGGGGDDAKTPSKATALLDA